MENINEPCVASSSQLEASNAPWFSRSQFNPVDHGLDASFQLTKFSGLIGRGCRVERFDQGRFVNVVEQQTDLMQEPATRIGIGTDCSVVLLRYGDLSLVQTTDFFYPICDNPYLMGRITCASILGDLYAMGVTKCNNMLMLLAVSSKMTEAEKCGVIPMITRGFKDCACEAGTNVSGGQGVQNPWLTIGGVATTVCQQNEFIVPNSAVAGDVLVLTKPLGTQVAVSAYQWLDVPERWDLIKSVTTKSHVQKAYQRGMDVMCRLNRIASLLMHKYEAHGATNVSGFGLLEQAANLAQVQNERVSFVIHYLPVIANMASVAKVFEDNFQLLQGCTVERSGGLLICLPLDQAVAFCKDFEQRGFQAWIIGDVEEGNRKARIIDNPEVLEIPAIDRDGELW